MGKGQRKKQDQTVAPQADVASDGLRILARLLAKAHGTRINKVGHFVGPDNGEQEAPVENRSDQLGNGDDEPSH